MITEYIRYKVPASRRQAFIDAYQSATEELDASPYCLGYEISAGHEEPEHFVVRIEWTSLEEHEKGFRGSALFGSFFTKVKPFFADILEMKHYERLALRHK